MTQLTVSIEDVSMLDQIRQAISLLRGVTSVTLKRQTKTGMDRAIDDIKHGRVYEAGSVEDLIKQCKAWSTRYATLATFQDVKLIEYECYKKDFLCRCQGFPFNRKLVRLHFAIFVFEPQKNVHVTYNARIASIYWHCRELLTDLSGHQWSSTFC